MKSLDSGPHLCTFSRSPSSALLPFLFWGRVPLLKNGYRKEISGTLELILSSLLDLVKVKGCSHTYVTLQAWAPPAPSWASPAASSSWPAQRASKRSAARPPGAAGGGGGRGLRLHREKWVGVWDTQKTGRGVLFGCFGKTIDGLIIYQGHLFASICPKKDEVSSWGFM